MHPYFPFPTNTLFHTFSPRQKINAKSQPAFPAFVYFCSGCWFGLIPPRCHDLVASDALHPIGQLPGWQEGILQPVEPTTGETWGDEMRDMTSRTSRISDIPTCHPLCSNWLVSLCFFKTILVFWLLTDAYSTLFKSLVASFFACTAQASLPVATESWQDDVGSTWIHVGSTLDPHCTDLECKNV